MMIEDRRQKREERRGKRNGWIKINANKKQEAKADDQKEIHLSFSSRND